MAHNICLGLVIAWPVMAFLLSPFWPYPIDGLEIIFFFAVWSVLWILLAVSSIDQIRRGVTSATVAASSNFASTLGWLLLVAIFFPFSLFVLAFYLSAIGQIRARRALSFLEHVRQAVTMNLPMPQMLAAAAQSETPVLGRNLWSTATALEDGESLGGAVKRFVPEISPQSVSLIEAGERSGRLPQVLSRMVEQGKLNIRRKSSEVGSMLGYPLIVGMVVFIVVSTFMIFIIPKFEKIFEDFEVRLPTPTLILMRMSRWLSGSLYPDQLTPGFVWIVLVGWVVWQVRFAIRRGRGRALVDPISWYVPISHAVQRDRGMGDICHLLEELLKAGMPMHQALSQAAGLNVNRVLKRRVRAWAAAVESGSDVGEAARKAGMPALAVGIIASSENGPGMIDALGFLRRFYDGRFSRVAALIQGAVAPAGTLIAAGIVGFVVVAIFYPLVVLIRAQM